MTKQRSLFFLLTFFLLTTAVPFVFAEEAPQLPDDNLIKNPWFRDNSNTTASHDGWIVSDAWGLSQKNTNPTADGTEGTSARIGTPKASYNENHFMSQVIEADADLPVLQFQMWQVSRSLVELKTTFYASQSPDGPWEEVWVPWHQTQSSVHWMQTPLFEVELDKGYPYYKLEVMCNYSHGIAGCKFSGMYFKVTDETGVGISASEAAELVPNDETRTNPNAVGLNLAGVTAVAISDQEIQISWPEHERTDATYQIERSFNGRSDWQVIDQVPADAWSYTDFGLTPDTEYYYRIQVSFDGGGRSRSDIFVGETLASEAETPVEPTAEPTAAPAVEPTATTELAEEQIVEPTATDEPNDVPIVEPDVEETAVITTSTDTNSPQNQYGLLLIGFGLGALLIGGIWAASRRKTDSK